MRLDAIVPVVCDRCHAEECWEPEYKYRDFTGLNGYHDVSDAAFKKWCEIEGWTEDDDGQTYCPACSEADERRE